MKPCAQFPGRISWLTSLWLVSAILAASFTTSWVQAQTSSDTWTEPVNLSQSGIAKNPAYVIDSQGVGHVLWQDEFSKYVYTQFDGEKWSTPETTDLDRVFNLPIDGQDPIYTGPNPLFIAAPNENIFAFWVSADGKLLRSKVRSSQFGRVAGWEGERSLASGAASFAVTLDSLGELHVAFIRTVPDDANPAGIYYMRSNTSGTAWTVPILLYESSYFRTLLPGEASLSLDTVETEDAFNVFVAWDNRPRKQVLFAHSMDGGKSWGSPEVVAGPAPDSGSAGPFNIRVGANQETVVLVWQSGQPQGACSQIFRSSSDAGANWTVPQVMVADVLGCAQSNEFLTGLTDSLEGSLLFFTQTKSEVFLTAWDGVQWSQAQEQTLLSGFEEPEIYEQVLLGCHRASVFEDRLYVVGCDLGPGGDIWAMSRVLASSSDSLQPPLWSQLSPVTSDPLAIRSVDMVTTSDGTFHTFFTQKDEPSIFYTNWDGELWSRFTSLLEMPDGEAGPPAAAVGPDNELFLIAPNNIGSLYFSRSSSGGALITSGWSSPARLSVVHDGRIGAADVVWASTGSIYVAYSVPVNDQRGIYIVASKDQGETWSEPVQVFDGVAAGFDFIGSPFVQMSANGSLHIVWKVHSIQGDGVPQPLSLFYARSNDGGQTFDKANQVVEEPVAWQALVTDGEDNLHLLWQPQNTLATVWDQISVDNGATWKYPQGLPDGGSLVAVAGDPAGRLHLVGTSSSALGHWILQGSSWKMDAAPSWRLTAQEGNALDSLTVAINQQGKMMVMLAQPTAAGDVALQYSIHTVKLSPTQRTTPKAPTQTFLTPTSAPATLTPPPLSTATSVIESVETRTPLQLEDSDGNNRLSPFTLAILPVALLLISVLGIVVWQATRAKDRS